LPSFLIDNVEWPGTGAVRSRR